MTRQPKTPFKIGDRVVRRHGKTNEVLTVRWISKGDTYRREQLIATEYNDYHHTCSDASLYEDAR